MLSERELAKLKEDIELLDIGGDDFTREKVGTRAADAGVLRQRDDQLRRAAVPGRVPGAGARAHVAPDDDTGRASRPTRSSPASSSRSRRTWTPRTATASRSCAWCPAATSKGMNAFHSRLGKEVRLAKPSQFLAAERTAIEEAWPGDVIGLFDPGQYRIGDTLAEGEDVEFEGVPRFSPEYFAVVRSKDPLRRKQMEKGLEQLSEEGTVQIFQQLADGHEGSHRRRGGRAPVRGAPVPAGARVRREDRAGPAALQPRALGGGRRTSTRSASTGKATGRRCRTATGCRWCSSATTGRSSTPRRSTRS